ncbi:hypothetical protein [Streptomyces sp. SPB162]|uniref:hypothetical protein n=1 Tax=Streptomyces sp. SPB162 TaxID=2940560 RepID=UPI00321686D5
MQDKDFRRWWRSSRVASRYPRPGRLHLRRRSRSGTRRQDGETGRPRATGYVPSPRGNEVGSAGLQPIRSTGLTV